MPIKNHRYSIILLIFLLPVTVFGQQKEFTIENDKLSLTLAHGDKAALIAMTVNGQKVVDAADGIYTSVTVNGKVLSSLKLKQKPVLTQSTGRVMLSGIAYGDKMLTITETWTFTKTNGAVKWTVERSLSKPVTLDESALPVINFDSIDTWEGAYQGYGGLAWFYLFNEKLCTYGVHTRSTSFWNSKTGNGLHITVDAPGKEVAMKYTRTNKDKLSYSVTESDKQMIPKADSDTHRRLFIRKGTQVWSPFNVGTGKNTASLTFSYFDYQQKYGRGKLVGVNGNDVSAVLGTIARIGVIDSLHNGGNSWATPYGPICLHEQYIAQMGLGINDPEYLKGYESCLDFYRDHAIKPDGRVYPRWAYTNEDSAPGAFNKYGFYEAQWGILMDSNPDLVTNVSELFDMTGDLAWVKTHQASCEKALEWIMKRDGNNNGLVEMMTDSHLRKKSSDWIDIIWASYENAFVNAKLYHALVKWAAVERQLGNVSKANYYKNFAGKLKASFNKPVSEGGFWDEENRCYIYWRDKDNSIHGQNMVTPINFMAIAYGICDDDNRKKLILDKIEGQMQKENLFFWPISLFPYKPDEGKEYQFPFPEYENGDLFLSWGSIGVAAYASYNPALALKYVRNVLAQYSKDGLAFQRYGRLKQDGRGDDILSGNSLSIVGLYQAIYGINPLYNRFYLDPHITPELAGTELKYNYRGQRLTISLNSNNYAVSNNQFKVISNKDFGFYAVKNKLSYFNGGSPVAALQLTTNAQLNITPTIWNTKKMEWDQTVRNASGQPVSYLIKQLKPNTKYVLSMNGKVVKKLISDKLGKLVFKRNLSETIEKITVTSEDTSR